MNSTADWRNIATGNEIPTENYSDQPYIVKTDDGAWLCIITTGTGREGQSGQHVGTVNLRQGFSVDMWIQFDSLESGQIVVDNRTESGKGFCLQTTTRGTLEIVLNDGRTENRWDSDPGMLEKDELHHVAVVVDVGPKIITFILDGKLCDGGQFRQFGWGRFSPNLREVNGDKTLRIAPNLKGEIKMLRVYNRYLRTSELIGNYLKSKIR